MSQYIRATLAAIICCSLYGAGAFAQTTTTWTGNAQDFDWNNTGNWDNGVPTTADNAVINISGGFNPFLDVDVTVNDLTINSGAAFVVNGQTVTINRHLTVTTSNSAGDGLIMTNVADEVIVGANTLFTTSSQHASASSAGNFAEGILRVRGNFTQTRSGTSASTSSFISTGTRVVFDGSGTQIVFFNDPGAGKSRFHDVGFENTSPNSVNLSSTIIINGQMQAPGHVTTVVNGANNIVTVNGGLDVEGLILDRVTLTVNNGQIDRFDQVTFRNYALSATQMTLNHADMNAIFAGLDFEVTPTSGKYLVANDTDGGTPATLTIVNANPTDGSALTTTTGGFVVNWVTQLYAVDDAGATLEETPVTISVLDNDLNPNENALAITDVTQSVNGGAVVIDPGGTTVTYTPPQDFIGTDTFTYTVVDNTDEVSDIGLVTMTLTPDNDNPVIVVASGLPIDRSVINQTVTGILTVNNTGNDKQNVSNLTISAPFSVDNTPFTVEPGGSHDVTVSFTPDQTGTFELILSITSNDPQKLVASVTVTGYGTPTGDLGGDGNLDILDLISLINIILGQSPTPVPGSQDFQAADLTGDGALNILDIVDLVNLILNPSPPAKTIAHITATVYVGLDPVQTLENRRQRVPVSLKTDAPVAGLQMTVRYDPSAIRLLEPEPTDRLGDLTMEWSNIEGVMQILIYSTTGQPIQPGQTHIVFIPVDVLTQEATLTLDQFIAANPQAGTLPVTITTGQLRVSTFPTVFSLGTNRPNPFNPSTTIAFDVPQVAHITLTIYNVLGQEVIRLIDEQRSPGRYEVAWNGRNAQGAGVSTGIYMYRLTSSTGFAEAKRMTLLK